MYIDVLTARAHKLSRIAWLQKVMWMLNYRLMKSDRIVLGWLVLHSYIVEETLKMIYSLIQRHTVYWDFDYAGNGVACRGKKYLKTLLS